MQPNTVEASPRHTPHVKRRENIWINLAVNILIPVVVLKKGSDWLPALAAVHVLFVALSFPVAYFLYDLWRRRKYNLFSILGFVSVLLTGGIGLLQLNPVWIAVKEAAVPAVIGLAVVLSLKSRYPLVRTFLYNRELMDVDRIDRALSDHGTRQCFDKLLVTCTWLLGASFLVSAILNFVLARIIVTTSPVENAVRFNSELGSLAMWSWPVIVIPCTLVMGFALWKLVAGIKALTGLEFEDVFKQR
jgi:intracellular septation protein A